jgi:hypothetical protein
VKGSAEMRSATDQEWTPLKAGDEISDGAWIQTAFKSRVYIKFWTNTVVQIKSVTLVQVKGLSNDGKRMAGRLHLALGAARIRVKPDREEIVDFKVVTTRMTVSIKGTVVEVISREGLASVRQIKGTAAISRRNSPSVTLDKGDSHDDKVTVSKEQGEEVSAIYGGGLNVETHCLDASFECLIKCSPMWSAMLAELILENTGNGGSSGFWTDNNPNQ